MRARAMQFRHRYLLVGICPAVVWVGTIIVVRFVTGLAWLDGLWVGAALVSIVWEWVMPRVLDAWQDYDEKQGRDVAESALLASLAVARLHDDEGTDTDGENS